MKVSAGSARILMDVSGYYVDNTIRATTVSAGGNHTCALTTAGAVKCWGWNSDGQLGNGTTTSSAVPVGVTGLGSGVAAVSTGSWHTCAVTTAGAVKCWGSNGWGGLGDGTTTDSAVPVDVSGLGSGAVAVGGGYGYSCARTSVGALKCWGSGWSGQSGLPQMMGTRSGEYGR